MNARNLGFWISRKLSYPFVQPDVIQIPLTYRCNLRCSMCSIHSNPAELKKMLSTEDIFDILRQAAAMGIAEVVLTGGEPFLRPDIYDIGKLCRDIGIRTIVTTNGMLIEQSVAERIIGSGLSHIHFSIDGLREAHDRVRGQGAFEKAVAAMRLLLDLRLKNGSAPSIGVACTVMDHNAGELADMVAYFDDAGADVINFQPFVKNNALTNERGESGFWVQPENLSVLKAQIANIKRMEKKHIQVYEEPELELLIKYYSGDISSADWKCFGGLKTVFICISDADNKTPLVYSCHGICGDLRKTSLKQAWFSGDARKLRLNAKRCKSVCLQSCYSKKDAQTLRYCLR